MSGLEFLDDENIEGVQFLDAEPIQPAQTDKQATETIYDVNRNKVYELPADLNYEDTDYLINKQEEPDAMYLGKNKLGYLHQTPNSFQDLIKSASIGNLGQALEIGVEENREPAKEFLDNTSENISDTPENIRRGAYAFAGNIATYLGGNLFVMTEEVADGILKKNFDKLEKGEVPDFLTNPIDMALVWKSAFMKDFELKKFGEELKEQTKNWVAKNNADKPTRDNVYNRYVFDLTQGMGFGLSGVAGVLTGNPVLMAGAFSAFQTSVSYEESRLSGKSELESLRIGTVAGGIEGALSLVSFGFMAKAFEGSGILKMAAQNAVINGTEELAQSLSNAAWMNYNDVRDNTLSEVVKDSLYDFSIGFLTGGIIGGGVGSAQAVVNRRIKANEELREKFTDEEIGQISESVGNFMEQNKDTFSPVNVLREEFNKVRETQIEIDDNLKSVIKDYVERKTIDVAPENLNIEKDYNLIKQVMAQEPYVPVNPKEELAKIVSEVNDLERLSTKNIDALVEKLREQYFRELASEKDTLFIKVEEVRDLYKQQGVVMEDSVKNYLEGVIDWNKHRTEATREMKGKKTAVQLAISLGGLKDTGGDLSAFIDNFRSSKKKKTLLTRKKKKSNLLVKAMKDDDYASQGSLFPSVNSGRIGGVLTLDEFGSVLQERGYLSYRPDTDEVLDIIRNEVSYGYKLYQPEVLDYYIQLEDMVKNQDMTEARISDIMSEIDGATKKNNTDLVNQLLLDIRDRYGEEMYNVALGLRSLEMSGVAEPFTRKIGEIRKMLAKSANARRQISRVEEKAMRQTLELSKKIQVEAMSENIPNEIARVRRYTIKDRVEFFKSGYAKGKSIARRETAMVQKEINRIIKDSDLGSEDKVTFLKRVKDINSVEKLSKVLDSLLVEINKAEVKRKLKLTKARIKKELKNSKAIDVGAGGRQIGKYTADIHHLFKNLKGIDKNPNGYAVDIQDVEGSVEGQNLATLYDQARQVALDEASLKTAQDYLENIRALKGIGRAKNKETIGARIRNREITKAIALEDIQVVYKKTQKKGVDSQFTSILKAIKRGSSKAFAVGVESFIMSDNYINRTYFGSKSDMFKILDHTLEVENQQRIEQASTAMFKSLVNDAYGTKKEGYNKKIHDLNSKRVKFNKLDPITGKRLEYSKLEIMNFYRDSLNESNKDRLIKSNDFNEAFLEDMFSHLSKADIKFAKSVGKIYKELYKLVNETHEKLTQLRLPKIKDYNPIRGEKTQDSHFVENIFGGEFRVPSAKSKSFVKMRKDLGRILPQNLISNLFTYINQASHYVSFAEKMDVVNAVYNKPEIKRVGVEMFGEMYWRSGSKVRDYLNNGKAVDFKGVIDKVATLLGRNFSRAALFGKFDMLPKQASSYLAFVDKVPYADFMKIKFDLMKNPSQMKEVVKYIAETPFMKARGNVVQMDMINLSKDKFFKSGYKVSVMDSVLGKFIKWGDRSAIYIGGSIYYKYLRQQGWTHKDALREVVKFSEETQQSTSINQIALLNLTSVGKVFGSFLSTPIAYVRKMVMTTRDYSRGDISHAQFIKTMTLYWSGLGMLFKLVSNLFVWDEEAMLDAAILGHSSGLFAFGWLFEFIYNETTKDYTAQRSLSNKLTPAFISNIVNVGKIYDKLEVEQSKRNPNPQKIDELETELLVMSLGIVGFPSSAAMGYIEGARHIEEGNYEEGTKRLFGFSRSASKLSWVTKDD